MRYDETQRFTSPLAWVPILGGAGLLWYGVFEQIIRDRPFGTNPAPDGWLAVFWLLFGIGMPWLFGAVRLSVRVDGDAVHVRFTPFQRHGRRWRFEEIDRVYPRDYRPIREYGGWGIRFGFGGKGRAYTVTGTRGVQLVLVDGSRVLIGSQHADRLAAAIQAGISRVAAPPKSPR